MWSTQLICLIISVIGVINCGTVPVNETMQAIERFRKYIQIDTSNPENLPKAIEFWQEMAEALDLPIAVYSPAGLPIVVITWQGTHPTLPSIMLNSHMDVVTVDESEWTYPPFEAFMDSANNIYGRGTQDAKDVGMQYIEAIRKLKSQNVTLQRTFHLTMMPDEETGGYNGMQAFKETEEFKALNIGFALDEGIPSTDENLYATFVDKRPWQLNITVFGETGHGSSMPSNTAAIKINRLMTRINSFRDTQIALKDAAVATDFGAYTSVNINKLNGGIATNIIADKMSLVVDIRLARYENVTTMTERVESWISETGNRTITSYLRHVNESAATAVDDSNPFWVAMQETATEIGFQINPVVCPSASDSIYLRNKGVPAIGFAAKAYTENHIHGNDEFLNGLVFLHGIEIYTNLLKKLGNVKESA